MPGAGAYRSLISRLGEITRRAVREPRTQMRVALKLSLDLDTSTKRMRMEATPIELRKPEIVPQSEARGIWVGVLLGVGAWAAIIALLVAVWRWFR